MWLPEIRFVYSPSNKKRKKIKVMTNQEFKSNKELAKVLIQELQHTMEEDYFTGKFLDLVGEYLVTLK